MVASESVALDTLGFKRVRDVAPGEAIVDRPRRQAARAPVRRQPRMHTPCIFEYVYLARPDSMIDGISVYEARLHMGETLAREDPAPDARTTTSTS